LYFLAAKSNQPTLAFSKAPIADRDAPSICSSLAKSEMARNASSPSRIENENEDALRADDYRF
jgi:hypothetical protein